jgi:hypothetical protein
MPCRRITPFNELELVFLKFNDEELKSLCHSLMKDHEQMVF